MARTERPKATLVLTDEVRARIVLACADGANYKAVATRLRCS
jgi:hypothetical protein